MKVLGLEFITRAALIRLSFVFVIMAVLFAGTAQAAKSKCGSHRSVMSKALLQEGYAFVGTAIAYDRIVLVILTKPREGEFLIYAVAPTGNGKEDNLCLLMPVNQLQLAAMQIA